MILVALFVVCTVYLVVFNGGITGGAMSPYTRTIRSTTRRILAVAVLVAQRTGKRPAVTIRPVLVTARKRRSYH